MIEGPRAAHDDERAAVIGLANAVFYPDGRFDMGRAFPTFFARDNLARLRVMVDDGRPISLAGFTLRDLSLNGVTLRAACIGSVCTRVEYRGQGIAARLMDDVVARAAEQGTVIVLISGGRGLYRRMGCVNAGLYRVISIAKKSGLPAIACDTRDWVEEDLPDMTALHQAEAVRFIRDAAEMRTLLESRMLFCRPARTFVVRRGGSILAYICCQGPDDLTGEGVVRAREIAGSRPALLTAAPAILEAQGAQVLEIETPAADIELESLARAYKLTCKDTGFHGTVKIIDRKGFFRSVEGYAVKRLTSEERDALQIECGPAVTFRCGSEQLSIHQDEDLSAMIFGSVERAVPAVGRGRLGNLLERLFLLPLPGYGLNYV